MLIDAKEKNEFRFDGSNLTKIIGADPDNAKKALSWEACGRVV
jgi:hypothetical protein